MTQIDFSFNNGILSVPDFFAAYEDWAIKTLRSYFTTRAGRFFEDLSRGGSPWRVDGSEIAAATCLSLRFDYERVGALMAIAPTIESLLSQVPVDIDIWDAGDEHIGGQSALWKIHESIKSLAGFGPAYTSKILAAKRPRLVPIRDNDVSELLGHPSTWWQPWHTIMSDADFRELLIRIRGTASLHRVSLLRVADVVLWEYAQR